MNARMMAVAGLAAILLNAGTGVADITIETVPVGNLGNTGELTGASAGGLEADRISGAVAYEYNIGKYEVTAGQYTAFLNAVADTDIYGLYNPSMWSSTYGCKIERYAGGGTSGDPYQYRVAADYANRPVNFVSWGDSVRFANWLTNGQGNGSTETGAYTLNGAMTDAELLAVAVPTAAQRAAWSTGATSYFLLTSEDEWYKAAYHKNDGITGNYFDYPTSSDTAPGRDLADASGNNANYYGTPFPIDSPYYTTLAGEFQDSDSPYSTFDQGGNNYEWTEEMLYSEARGLRGGNLSQTGMDLRASVRRRTYPSLEDSGIGFRVAQVPEPASLALLALGGLALIRRRRK